MDRQVRVRVEPWMEPAAAAGAWGLRDGHAVRADVQRRCVAAARGEASRDGHAVYARCGQMGRGGVCGEGACASRASTGPPTTPVAAARGASPRAREGDRRCERGGARGREAAAREPRQAGAGGTLWTWARARAQGLGTGSEEARGSAPPQGGSAGRRRRQATPTGRGRETSDGRLVEPGCLPAAGQNTPCATRRNGQTMDWSNGGRGSPAPSLFLSGIDSFDQWSNHLTSGRLV